MKKMPAAQQTPAELHMWQQKLQLCRSEEPAGYSMIQSEIQKSCRIKSAIDQKDSQIHSFCDILRPPQLPYQK